MVENTNTGKTNTAATKPTSTKPDPAPSVRDTIADEIGAAPFAPVVGDVPDPRLVSDDFVEGDQTGYAGTYGFDDTSVVGAIPFVDPKNIRADVTTGVQPDSGGDKLLAAAQAKAPNLTRQFVAVYKLTDQNLADIASGAVPPPPAIGPAHTSDLYLTPGGWTQTPPGISLETYAATQAVRTR